MALAPADRALALVITEALLERDLPFPRPAVLEDCPAHARALEVVEAIAEGRDGGDLALLPPCLREFLGALVLATHRAKPVHLRAFLVHNSQALEDHADFVIQPEHNADAQPWQRTYQDVLNGVWNLIARLPPARQMEALRQMARELSQEEAEQGE